MNELEKDYSAIDASCRVPLLALFGGAVLWLIVGLALALIASLTFHLPAMFGGCPFFTYGRLLPAANDAIVYGFAIPAALGVILWIFARLSETELLLPLVPVISANIWHLGVLIGVVAILIGDSTGFAWLEFPRCSSILLFVAFLLIAISAAATFGARRERVLQPPHWFLFAALFWFPWIYATANLFLVGFPVRGVAQAVIDWWFANNLIFVWLSLVGLGVAFYLIQKISGRPFRGFWFAGFGFWTFILFAPWCGIPQSAPVPAWLPASSAVACALTLIPLLAFAIAFVGSIRGVGVQCKGGPYCYAKFAVAVFLLAALMWLAAGCPEFGPVLEMSWFMPAAVLFQILGFFVIAVCGAAYEALPGVMGFQLPFPKFVRAQHWFFIIGLALLIVPLAVGGVVQGLQMRDPNIAFNDITRGTLNYLRVSSLGYVFLLVGAVLFAVNIFAATAIWKLRLLKAFAAVVTGPIEAQEAKS